MSYNLVDRIRKTYLLAFNSFVWMLLVIGQASRSYCVVALRFLENDEKNYIIQIHEKMEQGSGMWV